MIDETAEGTELRLRVRTVMTEANLTQVAAAKESGVNEKTFSAWLNGTYAGDNERVAANVARWLDSRAERARTVLTLPAPPPFVATPTAREITDRLIYVQASADFGVIVGAAGIGKTSAIEEYRRRSPNVWMMTADQSCKSANGMLAILADAIGVTERRSLWLSRAISNRVRGTSALIVIDEAQHLTTDALDQLRAIPDAAGCGVVVAGNESLLVRLTGEKGASAALRSQLFSRVGARFVGASAKARDIEMLIAAWGVTDEGVTKVLRAIARKPGALRLVGKTIRAASMYAEAEEIGQISATHIRQAWSQLSSSSLDVAA
ncbi:B transposition protein domain protein [Xanthobacter versatilis]|uniref:B transposition protein domain protein n=1 Tax=Xanthobacter autotrophicus (strain ATCC BAA-1158 / Py2) TaxID=78245 RepID=A7INZ9_XANP2|nr:B transposition protein domain protein [Xanthobacter autotrophicus Py2]